MRGKVDIWTDPILLTHYRPAMPAGKRKKILYSIFSVCYCHNFKNITPLETLNNLGIFQSLTLRILVF